MAHLQRLAETVPMETQDTELATSNVVSTMYSKFHQTTNVLFIVAHLFLN